MSVLIAWEERGRGEPVLLIHGLGYARWGWEPVIGGLAQGHRVVSFDNRGIGESDAPTGPYTAAELARDALRVLDEAGIERAHVVGTSLGGMVAQELVLDAPERVGRLVLVCTTPGGPHAAPMPAATVALMTEAATLEPLVALRRFVENALAPGAPVALVERILAHRVATAQPATAWAAQAAAAVGFDAWERLPSLETPTLVLHGTADVVVDPANAALLAERIPNSRVELFEGCGHLLLWEEPTRFVASVRGFLG